MSGENRPTEEDIEQLQAPYMLLGDTYADIMYAQQMIVEMPGKDTSTYETWLISWSDQLQEMFDSIEELDEETINEQVSHVADQVLNVIGELERMR